MHHDTVAEIGETFDPVASGYCFKRGLFWARPIRPQHREFQNQPLKMCS
jgi:hypothetical protein